MIDVGQFKRSEAVVSGVTCLPGRIAVVMDEVVPGSILLNKEAVTGVVCSSGCWEFPVGSRVIVHTEHGLQMDYRDAAWIPRGADVRFYGVHVPASDSVVAVLN